MLLCVLLSPADAYEDETDGFFVALFARQMHGQGGDAAGSQQDQYTPTATIGHDIIAEDGDDEEQEEDKEEEEGVDDLGLAAGSAMGALQSQPQQDSKQTAAPVSAGLVKRPGAGSSAAQRQRGKPPREEKRTAGAVIPLAAGRPKDKRQRV